MKKILLSITAAMLMLVVPATARDYEDISEYALFLTDKMAYELNLTEEQYEAAYEINYDYLYDVMRNGGFNDDLDDIYGRAWKSRNRDFQIVLLGYQYDMYKRLKYFYHPLQYSRGKVVIRIYNYYPQRNYLYFGCPHFVYSYRGGHGWRHYRNHSYYAGRAWHKSNCYGMRDGYRNGHRYYHNGTHNHGGHHSVYNGHGNRRYRDCHDSFRNTGNRGRVSSTRTTVNNKNVEREKTRGNIDRNRRLPDNRFSPRNNRSSRKTDNGSRNDNKNNDGGKGRFGGGR